MVTFLEGRGMDEQRYVVEITRPVPPGKVGQVAQRIAERLNVPVERIVTLLDGRMGEVTKPVLADKADAIAEVFTEAGVYVVVTGAKVVPPRYEEQFGVPVDRQEEPSAGAYGGGDTGGAAYEPAAEAAEYAEEAEYYSATDDADDTDRYDAGSSSDATTADAAGHDEVDDVPWGQDRSWGVDAGAIGGWHLPQDNDRDPDEPADPIEHRAADYYDLGTDPAADAADPTDSADPAAENDAYYDPYKDDTYQDDPYEDDYEDDAYEDGDAHAAISSPHVDGHGAEPGYDVPEEEADRLGPTRRPLRVEFEPPPGTLSEDDSPGSIGGHPGATPGGADANGGIGTGRSPSGGAGAGGYAASTRWTPSPHDPYAFSPQDAPGYEGRRSTPMGPARTTPLSTPSPDEFEPEPRPLTSDRGSIGGFFSPEVEPREGPQLRVYLLWALAISLLVLILLQFVMALRVDGAETAALGVYEAGLAAYRRGDFAAARSIWEPVADAGHAQAQYLLGFMLQNGLGQPWSNARAATWYRRAANQGHPEAQLALGDLYLRGMGVELDPRVGAAWYASAAVAGDKTGQFEYAKLLLHGVGVEKDMTAALAWFEAAAANGHEAAADYVEYARANAGNE